MFFRHRSFVDTPCFVRMKTRSIFPVRPSRSGAAYCFVAKKRKIAPIFKCQMKQLFNKFQLSKAERNSDGKHFTCVESMDLPQARTSKYDNFDDPFPSPPLEPEAISENFGQLLRWTELSCILELQFHVYVKQKTYTCTCILGSLANHRRGFAFRSRFRALFVLISTWS